MTRRIFCKVLLVVVAVFGLLVLSSVLSAQGRSEDAFERVRDVQERNTDRLLAMDGVEGTAIGYNQNDRLAIKVFTAGPGVRGIPQTLDGVPVQVVVTGKFYALPKPPSPPGQDKKDPPPTAPTGLTAMAVSDTVIDLVWDDNTDSDLASYKVYRSNTSGSYGEPIASVDKSDSRYSDTVGATSPIYYYVVTAVDLAEHESDYSNEAWATTDPGYEPPVEDPIGPRPAPIGVSTGHPDITAGTIGCRVKDSAGNVYALSNNHVYADENKASIGDNVLQPGPYDGGEDPRDAIGTLSDFETIMFLTGSEPEPTNTIDAAIALTTTDKLGNATPGDEYTPSSTIFEGELLGLSVQKYGRTTGLTKGKVSGVNTTVNVIYGSGTARFVNQILIMPDRGWFSKGGDSGSLIVTQDDNSPVGLLFAGGGRLTIANPIDAVLDRFVVSVDGE
ncbi:MAG: hypothetical protein HQ580_02870 [Planctomycetes bacterium]|nr:hypothetical protein [Planctomycetota bacterium]